MEKELTVYEYHKLGKKITGKDHLVFAIISAVCTAAMFALICFTEINNALCAACDVAMILIAACKVYGIVFYERKMIFNKTETVKTPATIKFLENEAEITRKRPDSEGNEFMEVCTLKYGEIASFKHDMFGINAIKIIGTVHSVWTDQNGAVVSDQVIEKGKIVLNLKDKDVKGIDFKKKIEEMAPITVEVVTLLS